MTFTKPWYQYYRKHLEVDETGAAKTYWKDNISSGPRRCNTIHLAEIWGYIKQKKGSSNYLRLYHQYIGTCKMINMLRKGIKFSIQGVYFPQSYFKSRHYGKRFNSIGKFKSLTFQLRAIYFHTFSVDMFVKSNMLRNDRKSLKWVSNPLILTWIRLKESLRLCLLSTNMLLNVEEVWYLRFLWDRYCERGNSELRLIISSSSIRILFRNCWKGLPSSVLFSFTMLDIRKSE